jgi:2-polyprenyl-3-methyl-5-hydroxy-6-metoxy-1,4-benzoquinol methylase
LDKIYQRIADYQTKDEYGYGAFDLSDCRKETLIDTHRRVNFLQANNLNFSAFLDFGCGCGGILEIVSDLSSIVDGLEIQKNKVNGLRSEGYRIFEQINDLEDSYYSLVTMFHVLEHLSDPVNTLKLILTKLKRGGY